jgi:hypothetical protein
MIWSVTLAAIQEEHIHELSVTAVQPLIKYTVGSYSESDQPRPHRHILFQTNFNEGHI